MFFLVDTEKIILSFLNNNIGKEFTAKQIRKLIARDTYSTNNCLRKMSREGKIQARTTSRKEKRTMPIGLARLLYSQKK